MNVFSLLLENTINSPLVISLSDMREKVMEVSVLSLLGAKIGHKYSLPSNYSPPPGSK